MKKIIKTFLITAVMVMTVLIGSTKGYCATKTYYDGNVSITVEHDELSKDMFSTGKLYNSFKCSIQGTSINFKSSIICLLVFTI